MLPYHALVCPCKQASSLELDQLEQEFGASSWGADSIAPSELCRGEACCQHHEAYVRSTPRQTCPDQVEDVGAGHLPSECALSV